MKSAVVLLSGGLDSSVTSYIARKDIGKRGNLAALVFNYGQKHHKEIGCATTICEYLEAEMVLVNLPMWDLIPSSLIIGQEEILEVLPGEGIPSTWVPQRNSMFLAFAFAYAEMIDADWIYAGFNVVDYSGYPDCRPEYVERMNRALNLGSKRYVETGRGFSIVTPLMGKSKSEIIKVGLELEVPFEHTWSCYQGREKACGKCDSCRFRLKAFAEVGVCDPVEYEDD